MKTYILRIENEYSSTRVLGVYSSLQAAQDNMRNYIDAYYYNVKDWFKHFAQSARYDAQHPGACCAPCWFDIIEREMDETLGRPKPDKVT